MATPIYDPQEEFDKKFKALHAEKAAAFFDALVQRSGVNIEENRETVRQYDLCRQGLAKLRRKLNWLRFLRVLMCLTVLLIVLVIWKLNPKIKALRKQIETADRRSAELMEQAKDQMAPLNVLFTDRDCLTLVQDTIPLLRFEPHFSVQQEADMRLNYDFVSTDSPDESTCDLLAGHYNENPFLFENRIIHTLGEKTYHGYKTIHWTEQYRDSNGKMATRTRSETLHATVTKPKPYYHTQVVLNYCAQGGPELSFTRDATHLDEKSEAAVKRHIKRGTKKIRQKTERALRTNDDFTGMTNTEFEVLFDALDRTDEVQFRTLFTPLAQTNMVDLLLSKTGFGDDFHFIKARRSNQIVSQHSQNRPLILPPTDYISYSFDVIRENFLSKNADFFMAVYFDFAPLWAIPIYQERPVHSLNPIPSCSQLYSLKECQALANAIDSDLVTHPDTKTQAILKSSFVRSSGVTDETRVTAYSYDIAKRVETVHMLGGDGRSHAVAVEWDEYLPLEHSRSFFVAPADAAQHQHIVARRNGLCMFKS